MNDEERMNELVKFFKALSDEERLKIVGLVAVGSQEAGELAERLNRPLRVALNHLGYLLHLGLLQAASGATEMEALGADDRFSLNRPALQAMKQRLLAGQRERFEAPEEGDAFDRKVLRDFLTPQGQFKSLPAQEKKLLVILRYAVQVFTPGERYPEKQVNELLRKYTADTATLRRCLVDFKLMDRQEGQYWRTE